MARGRMISKSISTSRKYAALHVVAPQLAEFCQAIYPLLVVHSDDHGRQAGDSFTVKHVVCPTSPRSLQDVEDALRVLERVGLISRFDTPDGPAIEIVKFKPHQPGLKQRSTSKFETPASPASQHDEQDTAPLLATPATPISETDVCHEVPRS